MDEEKLFCQVRKPRSAITNDQAEMKNTRQFWRRLLGSAGVALILGATTAAAQYPRDSWYFSAAEIGAAYQYQENYGGRMRNALPLSVA